MTIDLPVIVDVVIGLVFIYFILSLLASEIQELLATILQWRAKHLKESIEMLLMGGSQETCNPNKKNTQHDREVEQQIRQTRQLANALYDHPLISSLNFEKTGKLARLIRKYLGWVERFFRSLDGSGNDVFGGKNSAPSHIPPDVFAKTIVDSLKIGRIIKELNADKVHSLERELIKRINQGWRFLALEQNVGDDLKFELDSERLINIVRRIGDDLNDGKIDFKSAITSIQTQLDQYILFAEKLPEGANKQQFIYQLKMLERNIYVDEQTAMWLNSTAANISQVINGYKAIKSLGYFDENDPVQQKIKEVLMDGEDGVETVLAKIRHLPERLVSNLATIAIEAKSKVEDVEEEIKNFNGGLKIWFDNGIARASGVYKRNAKGVSFLIGLVVALAANADTFHMVERLSIDSDVRGLVLEEATQTIAAYPPEDRLIQAPELTTPTPSSNNNATPPPPPPPIGAEPEGSSNQSSTEGNSAAPEANPVPTSELSQQQIQQMQERAREITESFPLPIGWGKDNLDLQKTGTEDWRIGGLYVGWLRIGVGWFVTAVAVSMGAPFWYQILGKVIDIKNIGKKNTSENSGN